jgi:signal transduction histidine kinase
VRRNRFSFHCDDRDTRLGTAGLDKPFREKAMGRPEVRAEKGETGETPVIAAIDLNVSVLLAPQVGPEPTILASVSDTGIGLPPQLAEQIFDPIFTTKPHGAGVGLRISRSIIESHGGRLWAAGSPGRGATFT